jgi:hypothetical protein
VAVPFRTIEDLVYFARLRTPVAAEQQVGAPIAERLDAVADLLQAGEAGVALEVLCANLDEYGVRLEGTDYRAITEIGTELGVDPERWEFLAELVSDDPPAGYVEPEVVWAVECKAPSDQSTYQLGIFASEAEAQRLLDIKSSVQGGEIYINVLPVHRTVVDWEWDE